MRSPGAGAAPQNRTLEIGRERQPTRSRGHRDADERIRRKQACATTGGCRLPRPKMTGACLPLMGELELAELGAHAFAAKRAPEHRLPSAVRTVAFPTARACTAARLTASAPAGTTPAGLIPALSLIARCICEMAWSRGCRFRRRERIGSVDARPVKRHNCGVTSEPLRAVRDHLSEIVDRVEREHDRVVITRNGREAAVLLSAADLAELEETLSVLSDPEALADIREADAAFARGEVVRGVDAVRALRS